jgi:ribonuclease HIII
MPLKCADVAQANQAIQVVFSVNPDLSNLGKAVYKIEGVTLTIFDTKTVLFQGGNNPAVIERIKQVIGLA